MSHFNTVLNERTKMNRSELLITSEVSGGPRGAGPLQAGISAPGRPGRELVQRFQQWYADVESFAKKRAEALFSDFDKE